MPRKPRDYEVGYGRPPKEHQFQPGISGNPKGRRKGARGVAAVLHEKMFERITISQNGRRTSITFLEAIVMRLRQQAAAGDARAIEQFIRLLPMMEQHGLRAAEAGQGNPPQAEDLKALDDFLATYGKDLESKP